MTKGDELTFADAYVEAAFWTEQEDVNDAPLAPEGWEAIKADCVRFIEKAGTLLDGIEAGQAGHDFWLTRNHHGAGFWDRGLGEDGEKLTEIAQGFPEANLYVGDDGKAYHQ